MPIDAISFRNYLYKQAALFEQWYEQERARDPRDNPEKLEVPDWCEMFVTFLERLH